MSNTPSLKLEAYPLSLALWENTSDSGHTYYSGKLEKRYRKKDTGEYVSTNNINDRDFLTAAALLTEAYRMLKVKDSEVRVTQERQCTGELLNETETPW